MRAPLLSGGQNAVKKDRAPCRSGPSQNPGPAPLTRLAWRSALLQRTPAGGPSLRWPESRGAAGPAADRTAALSAGLALLGASGRLDAGHHRIRHPSRDSEGERSFCMSVRPIPGRQPTAGPAGCTVTFGHASHRGHGCWSRRRSSSRSLIRGRAVNPPAGHLVAGPAPRTRSSQLRPRVRTGRAES